MFLNMQIYKFTCKQKRKPGTRQGTLGETYKEHQEEKTKKTRGATQGTPVEINKEHQEKHTRDTRRREGATDG